MTQRAAQPTPRLGAPGLSEKASGPRSVAISQPRPKALLVAHSSHLRDAVRSALVPLPLELSIANDPSHALDHLPNARCEVLLIEPSCLGANPLDALGLIRAMPAPPFVLGVVDRYSPATLTALLAGGMDDFVSVPCQSDELRVRLHEVWPRYPVTPVAPKLGAWPGAEAFPGVLCAELGVFAGGDVVLNPSSDAASDGALGDALGAMITLTQPDGQTELSVIVDMPRATAEGIVAAVLGAHPDAATMDDLLCEMANISGGALKRLLLQDRAVFTLGLPSALSANRPGTAPPELSVPMRSVYGPMRCSVTARRTTLLAVPLHALREGLVLAQDVRSSNGMLLLSAGLRLTTTSVERLQRILDRSVQVEVRSAE